jgi:hypothetical protein
VALPQDPQVFGNLQFSSLAARITGDFSNATVASRVAFQSSTTNGATRLMVIPNGTSDTAVLNIFNNSDSTNAGLGSIGVNAGDIRITSGITGTGTYLPMTFYTGGSERVRIDTSGNVGIGTTSPAKRLQINSADTTDGIRLYSSDNGGEGLSLEWMSAFGSNRITADIESDASGGGGNFAIRVADTSATLQNRLHIDNAGNVGIGLTSPSAKLEVNGQIRPSGTTAQAIYIYGAATVKPYITINEFGVRSWDIGAGYYSTGTFSIQSGQVNGVYLGATATAWASASDERLKDIIEPISNALTKVNGLRSVIGKYKTDEEGVRRSFLIAQDIQTQFPEALESSDSERLGVQYTDVIPLLVASIKELKAINDTQAETINALTARIEALENR